MALPETNEADAASGGDASDDKRSDYVPLYPQRWKGHAAADVGLRRCGAVELSETASPGWRHHVQVQSTWAALVAVDMRRELGGCSRAVRALLSSAALVSSVSTLDEHRPVLRFMSIATVRRHELAVATW